MKVLLYIQGLYYFLLGLWPIVHASSYLQVTGGSDIWLVKMTGGLLAISGLILFLESRKQFFADSVLALSIAVAAFLAFIDVYYVQTGTVSSIYLFDALLQLFFIGFWLIARKRTRRNNTVITA